MILPTVAPRFEPTILKWLRTAFPDTVFVTRLNAKKGDQVLIILDYLDKNTEVSQVVNVRITVYGNNMQPTIDLDKAYKLMADIQRFLLAQHATTPAVSATMLTGTSRIVDSSVNRECLYSVMQFAITAQ